MLDMSPAPIDTAPLGHATPSGQSTPQPRTGPSLPRVLAYAVVIAAGLGLGLVVGLIAAIGSGAMPLC